MTKVECRADGLHITINNKHHHINGDFRVLASSGGFVKLGYGPNYTQIVGIQVSETNYANTQALLTAINCGGTNNDGEDNSGGGDNGGGNGGDGGLKYYAEGDMSFSDITGNNRGALSFDFQQFRTSNDRIIAGVRSAGFGQSNLIDALTQEAFILGSGNTIRYDSIREQIAHQSFLAGIDGLIMGWRGFAGGNRPVITAKIGTGFGNGPYVGGNDSFVAGNRASSGALRCVVVETGFDANHGIAGNTDMLPYIILADSIAEYDDIHIRYGDLRGYFPCAYTYQKAANLAALQADIDALYSIYGITAGSYSMNSTGYVYSIAAGFDGTQNTWAMPPYFWIKDGVSETGIVEVQCANTSYDPEVGTKIYYFLPPDNQYVTLALDQAVSVYSSYSPVILNMGNGQFSGGRFTSTTGHGATGFGELGESWGPGSFTWGIQNRAWAAGSMAGTFGAIVTKNGLYGFCLSFLGVTNSLYGATINYKNQSHGAASFAQGWETKTRGIAAQSGGYRSEADGNYSTSNNYECRSPGLGANAKNYKSTAAGSYSEAGGFGGETKLNGEYAWGAYAPTLDDGAVQHHRYQTADITTAQGFYFKPVISQIESFTMYSGTIHVTTLQTGGVNGKPGENATWDGRFTFTTGRQYSYEASNVDIATDYINVPNPPEVGDRVIFSVAFGGVLSTTRYHVVTSDASGIQISTSAGGSVLNITAQPSSTGLMTVVRYNASSADITQTTFDFEDDGDDVSVMNLEFEPNNAFWADSSGPFFRLKQTALNNRILEHTYKFFWTAHKYSE